MTLARLRATVLDHLSEDPARAPLGGPSIYHSRRPQTLCRVPIHQPTLILITGGLKVTTLGERRIEVQAGELLLLPGGCTMKAGNYPAPDTDYLAILVGFPEQAIAQFRRDYGGTALAETTPLWRAPAPTDLITALGQWVDWCRHHPVDPILARHRQVELLLLLARAGMAGNLLLHREAAWRERVAQLIALDPARDWSAGEISRRLGIGESTLRRRLQEEASSLREVLEESRLAAGLALLQETFWPVGQVAEAVGYRSQSRFSERFKRRFGLSPTELKRSRASVPGETVNG